MHDVNLGQVAYNHIKLRICDGQSPMGFKMSEAQLARDIEISRTPVRIALARLEAEGFLTWEPNRGYRVKVFSIEDVRAIYGVRAMLESEAVRLCGRRTIPSALTQELTSLSAMMGEIVSHSGEAPDNRARFLQLNHRFHQLIYENCGNPFLLRQIGSTADLPLALRNYFAFSDEQLKESHAAHVSILSTLISGEPDRAAGLMREHIWAARDRMSVRKTRRKIEGGSRQPSSRGKIILVPSKYRGTQKEENRNDKSTKPERAS